MRLTATILVCLAAAATVFAQPKTFGSAARNEAPLVMPADGSALARAGATLHVLDTDDGSQVAIVRIATGGVAARLHMRNIALPEGVRMYLYGRSGQQADGRAFGPYVGTGPLHSGEFWTHPVEGSEIVVELQSDSSLPAGVPFEIAEVAPTDDRYDPLFDETDASGLDIRTSMFRGVPLTHAVSSGWAVFEGDIILGRADELTPAYGKSGDNGRRGAVAITGSKYRWPDGTIPYTIDATMPNQGRVTAAIDHWNNTMTGHVRLVPRTTETAFVKFARASASTCSSSVGRLGYQQNINIGDYCSTGNVIHEIGHAAGLWHEQAREDRDRYVRILWANITAGTEHNFSQRISDGDDIGAYNYGSVMHYPATAFSSNGLPTIETIPSGIPIGQRSGLNSGDVAGLRLMYPASSPAPPPPPPSTVSVTVSSNPTGMPVALDGAAAVAPVTVNWTSGSVHTVAALNPAAVNGTRLTFAKWTDGGAATHQITVPSSSTTLRADYTNSYLLTATAVPTGTVTRTPASADGYHTAGSTVQVTASAGYSYCFTGWTGLTPGTPSTASLTMTAPYAIQANFQTGAVSASPSYLFDDRKGGTFQISVSASAGCLWKAVSDSSWVTVTGGGSGAGPGVVTISIASKKGGNSRSAQVNIGGAIVSVVQK